MNNTELVERLEILRGVVNDIDDLEVSSSDRAHLYTALEQIYDLIKELKTDSHVPTLREVSRFY